MNNVLPPRPAFVPGDIVYLNSGSPPLQVTYCFPPTPEKPHGELGVVWATADGYGHVLNGLPVVCVSKENNPAWPDNLQLPNAKSLTTSATPSSGSKTTRTKSSRQ